MMKKSGILLLIVGVLTLVVSALADWADKNSTRLVGLVLVFGGAIVLLYVKKKESVY